MRSSRQVVIVRAPGLSTSTVTPEGAFGFPERDARRAASGPYVDAMGFGYATDEMTALVRAVKECR
jgi:hypothetical protein